MRTIAITTYFLIVAFGLSAQGLYNIYIEEIPIRSVKLQNDLSADFTTYRIFADLEDDYKFYSLYGTKDSPLQVKTLSFFYNTPSSGTYNASDIAEIPSVNDPLYHDSWFAIGEIGTGSKSLFIVKMSEDNEGAKDGFVKNWQNYSVEISNTANLHIFGNSMASKNYLSDSVIMYTKGISGSKASNSVCLGQFTTKGVFSMEFIIKIKHKDATEYEEWLLKVAITPDDKESKIKKQTIKQNIPPYIEFISPMDGTQFRVGDTYSIRANTKDTDGEVKSVSFYMNNKHLLTDITPDDGFSLRYTAMNKGTASLFAVATDDMGGKRHSGTVHIQIDNPIDSLNYTIGDISESCISSDYVCMPFIAKRPIDSIIGFDIDIVFDPQKVTPTGNVTVPDEVIGNSDWISSRSNLLDENVIRITIYKNIFAPANAYFKGEGEIFCVEFIKTENFHAIDTAYFTAPVLTESYGTYYFENAAETGMLTSYRERYFKSTLTFWGDNRSIDILQNDSTQTNISGVTSQTLFQPDSIGMFTYNFGYGTTVRMKRELDSSLDLQPFISGDDAYFTSLVTVKDSNFKPNAFSLIAMDVNRDGRITAGDISQIQQRTLGKRPFYDQNSKTYADWVFVPVSDIVNNPSYRISKNYPLSDSIGFTAQKVPLPKNSIVLPIDDASACPNIRTDSYKAILLGDATGNYAQNDTAYSDKIRMVIHPNYKDTVDVNVYFESDENIRSFDIGFLLDSSLSVADIEYNASMEIQSNSIDSSFIKISGFGKAELSELDTVLQLRFKTMGELFPNMLQVQTSLVNEKYCVVEKEHKFDPNAKDSIQIFVYPNPAQHVIYVDMNSNGAKVELLNSIGIKYDEAIMENYQVKFDVVLYKTGIYIIRISKDDYVSNHLVDIIKHKDK